MESSMTKRLLTTLVFLLTTSLAVPNTGHAFTTDGGDQNVTMFHLKSLEVIKQIKVGGGLDGIMYDEPDDKIILTNHSRPIGTLTAIAPKTGDIVATVELDDT